jgi:hypothetical protein
MGTRCVTYVYNENREKIICLYRQFDGYPSGHGYELSQFLNSIKVVNGIPSDDNRRSANGMGCLAAQLVAHFKTECGNFYLEPPTDDGDYGQDYEYHLYHDRVTIKDVHNPKNDFVGPWSTLQKFCKSEDTPTSFDTVEGKDWLKSVLKEQIVEVTFLKTDGTERVMKCTINPDYIEPNENGNKAYKARKQPVVAQPVWDVEENAWRSFRWDSIKKVEVHLGK